MLTGVCNDKGCSKRDRFFITQRHEGCSVAEQARAALLSDDCDPSTERCDREQDANEKKPKAYGGRGGAFPVV